MRKPVIELTTGIAVMLRDAMNEFGTVPPSAVANDPVRLERWREVHALYETQRLAVLRAAEDFLVAEVDRQLR